MTQEKDTYTDKDVVPPGWVRRQYKETFSSRAGPFLFREEGPEPGVGFFSKPHHGNLGGIVHGGALMTLADMALFDVCFRAQKQSYQAVTVTLNAEFLNAAPIGAFIIATGDLVKSGRRLSFVRGLITADEKPLLSFSGSLMRIG